ncbi:glycosyltransferase family 4 protein [Methylocella sp. CPCC 101449]|uniref:glycosyltransferase family 4 protein n=1 Tax=Methylocella sp. CPCC 101449 TaxID=2987531 RepID=UPI00288E17DB|nr:glycosyltransferase family 4 protein [Methylocella sp. CPCC 101449]MDT2022995.1 glycosyltransferase family 4 protein [Methylocella sp. CPCC 101449]
MTETGSVSQKRLLIISPVGLFGQGGIDRLLFYFLDDLRERGQPMIFDLIGARGEAKGWRWVPHFVLALVRFTWLLATRSYGLVHIHVSTDGSALRKQAFGAVARLLGVPYVIHFHGMISDETIARNPLWLRALGRLARGSDSVIVLGEAFRKPFRDALRVENSRIEVIYNGVPDIRADATIPRLYDGVLSLLFCGEIGNRKGVDLLISALAQLKSDDWECTIAGNGSMQPYEAAIAEAGISERLDIRGWLSLPEVHQLMQQADVVILPSRAEALPLSLIEGACAGNALIATKIGAVAEVVHEGVNGFLVPHDPAAIVAVIKQLTQEPMTLAGMQEQSRKLYEERFTVPVFVNAILAIYRRYGVV